MATGPVRRTLAGPVRVGLLGRRADVSLLVVVLAPAVAVATAAWLGSSVGFETLERWVRGTWYGTDPHVGVFLGCAFLLGIAVRHVVDVLRGQSGRSSPAEGACTGRRSS